MILPRPFTAALKTDANVPFAVSPPTLCDVSLCVTVPDSDYVTEYVFFLQSFSCHFYSSKKIEY